MSRHLRHLSRNFLRLMKSNENENELKASPVLLPNIIQFSHTIENICHSERKLGFSSFDYSRQLLFFIGITARHLEQCLLQLLNPLLLSMIAAKMSPPQ